MAWLGWVAGILGLVWIATSFGGGEREGLSGHLRRRGRDPRAAGPAIWAQRVMGVLLVVLGALLGLHRL